MASKRNPRYLYAALSFLAASLLLIGFYGACLVIAEFFGLE